MQTIDPPLGFTFEMAGVDRGALLTDAAQQFNAAAGHLAPGDDSARETVTAAFARALLEDAAEFAGFPEVYRIRDDDVRTSRPPLSAHLQELTGEFNFYWVHIPILLRPQRNWAFNRLEVMIEFNPGEPLPHTRPKAYQILPNREFQTLLEASDSLEVRLNENLEFSATTGSLAGDLGPASGRATASAGATLAGDLALKAGRFEYRLKRARIDHTAVGLEKVFWRLDGAKFFQEDAPALIVITQVPKETREVKIAAVLQAYRYFSWLSADVQAAVEQLTRSVRNFFKAGAPLQHSVVWDLTPRL